jgi:hypothetical protein
MATATRKTTLPDANKIVLASLVTSIQLALPIAKIMSKMGSVMVITEDKSWLSLSPAFDEDFELGNIRVKVVDLVDECENETWYSGDYNFHLYICSSYIPQIIPDKYILYTSREFYRTQVKAIGGNDKPIYTNIDIRKIDPKQRASVKKSIFIKETQVDLDNSSTYAKFVADITQLKKTAMQPPPKLTKFIAQLMDGHQDLTQKDIKAWLREEISAL